MSTDATEVIDVALTELRSHPGNVRERFDGNDMKQLAASVKEHGVLHPLLARPIWQQTIGDDGAESWELDHYQVIAGHRRLRAAETAGLERLPIVVREMDDVQALQAMLVENLQRADLTVVEEARGYLRLTETGMTVKDLAGKVGRSQKHVSGRLKLLSAPSWLLDQLHAGNATLAEAETYIELAGEVERRYEAMISELETRFYDELQEAVAYEFGQGGSRSAIRLYEHRLRELKRSSVLAEVEHKAKEKSIGFLRMEPNSQGWGLKWPAGTAPVADLNLDLKAHRKEPCHAVGVDEMKSDSLHSVELCSNRSRHTKSGASELKPKDMDKRVAEREKAKEQKQVAFEKHRQFVARVRKTVSEAKPTQLRDLSTLAYSRSSFRSDEDKIVAEILGLDVADGTAAFVAVHNYAAESSANTARAAAAYAIVTSRGGFGPAKDVAEYANALMDDIAGPESEQPPS